MSGGLKLSSAIDWVNEVKERLCVMAELVEIKEGKAKQAMKKQNDNKAKHREFDVGSLVCGKNTRFRGQAGRCVHYFEGSIAIEAADIQLETHTLSY